MQPSSREKMLEIFRFARIIWFVDDESLLEINGFLNFEFVRISVVSDYASAIRLHVLKTKVRSSPGNYKYLRKY